VPLSRPCERIGRRPKSHRADFNQGDRGPSLLGVSVVSLEPR